MDIPDIYNLDNFNKTPNVIKIIINYTYEYITIYYNGIIDHTIIMKPDNRDDWLYDSNKIYKLNNKSLGELLFDKTYNITCDRGCDFQEEILFCDLENNDKAYLYIHSAIEKNEKPLYDECVVTINIFNSSYSNLIRFNVDPNTIFNSYGSNGNKEIRFLYCPDEELDELCDAKMRINKCIFLKKTSSHIAAEFVAKIINNLTFDSYTKLVELKPVYNSKVMTLYFYEFKIKSGNNSHIILILRNIKTIKKNYNITYKMNNVIRFNINEFRMNVKRIYSHPANQRDNYIINPYFNEYPYALKCF